MKESNKIFFGDTGLTQTSANHVANIAKELVCNLEKGLQNIQFYNKSVSLIGSGEEQELEDGENDDYIAHIPVMLNELAAHHVLIAWLREAIKAKDEMLNEAKNMSLEEYAASWDIELPVKPVKREPITKEGAIAQLSIKERNRIYTLQARAAVIGKYIHPDGNFANARAELAHILYNPHTVNGTGRDALIYTYKPSCTPSEVEDVFFRLQAEHRSIQAELNGIMHNIDEKVRADQMASMATYNLAMVEYRNKMEEICAKFEEYKIKVAENIANNLKIIIPNDLKVVYEKCNSIGK